MTITRVLPILPLGGLRTGQTGVATSCGQLAPISAITEVVLDPGQRTWLIGDFDVTRDGCPSPLPVQMQVSYSQAGAKQVVRLTGFKDLTQVRFEGC